MEENLPPSIDVHELESRLLDGTGLLDVRTLEEVQEMRIAGAKHIPLDELSNRLAELNQGEEYCVICAKGGRSAKATEFLLASGYRAVNVDGGTDAWMESGKPFE